MKRVARAYSVEDTCRLVRQRIDLDFNFTHWLADHRRGRPRLRPVLLPVGQHYHAGRWRPVYAAQDIEAFINEMLKRNPAAAVTAPPEPVLLVVDTSDTRPWRY